MKRVAAPFRKLWTSVIWWSGLVLSILAYFLIGAALDKEAKAQFQHETKIVETALQ